MKLNEKHFEVMLAIEGGATIFGYVDALRLREVQRYDADLIIIIDDIEELEIITNTKYNGVERLPYFGAIITQKGKELLAKINSEYGQ